MLQSPRSHSAFPRKQRLRQSLQGPGGAGDGCGSRGGGYTLGFHFQLGGRRCYWDSPCLCSLHVSLVNRGNFPSRRKSWRAAKEESRLPLGYLEGDAVQMKGSQADKDISLAGGLSGASSAHLVSGALLRPDVGTPAGAGATLKSWTSVCCASGACTC